MKLVLIVEDEHGASEILQALLESYDFRVASAANGDDAIALLSGEKPALILSDFMMPHKNGAELGLYVRREPLLSDIPFVFLSGTNEAVVRAIFKDYDGFISKPYDISSLVTILEKLIASGRPTAATSAEIDQSMRHLLRGIELPPES